MIIMQRLLTGASPGHSYTVKSPSSFSSSVEAPESGTLGSSLCLQRSHTNTHTDIKTSHEIGQHRLKEAERAEGVRDRGQETDIHMARPHEHVCTEGDSLLQGKHLLFLVLVVVHLSTVGQLLVPRLEHKEGQRGHEKSLVFIHIYSHCSVDIHVSVLHMFLYPGLLKKRLR